MLRLFKVKTVRDGEPRYFNSKRAAKKARDVAREKGYKESRLMRGPDHRKGETF